MINSHLVQAILIGTIIIFTSTGEVFSRNNSSIETTELNQAIRQIEPVLDARDQLEAQKGYVLPAVMTLPADPLYWQWLEFSPNYLKSNRGRQFLVALRTLLKHGVCYKDKVALKLAYRVHKTTLGSFLLTLQEFYVEHLASSIGLSLPFYSSHNWEFLPGGAPIGTHERLLQISIAISEKRYDDALALNPGLAELCDKAKEPEATE